LKISGKTRMGEDCCRILAPRPQNPARRASAPSVGTLSDHYRASLQQRLQRYLSAPLALTLTDNHSTMVSVKRRGGTLRARAHYMFTDAPDRVLRALARYIARADRRDSALLGGFVEANHWRIRRARAARRRRMVLDPAGSVHHLGEILDDLNRRYFDGAIEARITWGPKARPRHRQSIKMGSYSVEDRLIRIHPSLDRGQVPRYFVEWIVFHEMLHEIFDIPKVNGRRRFHTREFLSRERQFEHYERARRWERRNLDHLLLG
jgi:hypothetical protein